MPVLTCRLWTEEELDMLRRCFPTTSSKELSGRMDRSSTAIAQKAHTLGIYKNSSAKFHKSSTVKYHKNYKKNFSSAYELVKLVLPESSTFHFDGYTVIVVKN